MSRIKFSQLIPAIQTDLDNDTIFAVVNLGVSKKTTISEVKNFLISQGIATESYVDSAISLTMADLIGSAPEILDTLEELANAINNQADFATGIRSYIDSQVSGLFDTKTTDNLAEGTTNLYFTSSRSRASISISDPSNTLTYNPITGVISFDFGALSQVTSVNAQIGAVVLDTDDVNEGTNNRYFTETRSRLSIGVVDPLDALVYDPNSGVLTFNADNVVKLVNGQRGTVVLDTDDINEGAVNQYFTSTRSRQSISVVDPLNRLSYDDTTGVFSFTANSLVTSVVGRTGDVTLSTTDISEGSNLYYTNARSRAAISTNDPGGYLTYNSGTGVINLALPTLVTNINGQTGSVSLDTDDVPEGTINQYFTTARSRVSVSVSDPFNRLAYNDATGIFTFTANSLVTSVAGRAGAVTLNTADVAEDSSNLYFTTERSRNSISVVDPLNRLAYDNLTGVLTFTSNSIVTSVAGRIGDVTLSTTDVSEGVNLYYTDVRARSAISVTDNNGYLTYDNGSGVITLSLPTLVTSVNGQTGAAVLDTDDIVEGGTNLYYADSRARLAISVNDPGGYLSYDSSTGVITLAMSTLVTSVAGRTGDVTLTTDDVGEGNNLYYTDARARQALFAGTGVTYDDTSGVISIGQDVGTASSPSFNGVTVTGTTASTSTTTGAVTVAGGVGIGGNLNVGGTITHNGVIPTEGTNIDQIKTIVVNMRLEAEWLDTGINNGVLSTGTYAIQLYADDTAVGGTNDNEYYSGMMSWYSGNPNSTDVQPTDEIPLHRAGGSNEGSLYLRTFRTLSADDKDLKLQIFSNYDVPAASNYTFKFRRLI